MVHLAVLLESQLESVLVEDNQSPINMLPQRDGQINVKSVAGIVAALSHDRSRDRSPPVMTAYVTV